MGHLRLVSVIKECASCEIDFYAIDDAVHCVQYIDTANQELDLERECDNCGCPMHNDNEFCSDACEEAYYGDKESNFDNELYNMDIDENH